MNIKSFQALLFAVSLFAASAVLADSLTVIQASYGLSCSPYLRNNMTDTVRQACRGKTLCHFTIDHERHGDPAPMCRKDFVVDYTCGSTSSTKTSAISAEASKQYVTLDCSQ